MANEWRTAVLGDLTVNHDGKRKPVKESDRRPGPYPYYGASGIVDYVDGYLFDGDYLLIAEDGENLRTRKTPIAFMARGKSWVNNHAHIVTGNDEADTRFLMYAIEGADISGYLTGAVMPKLTQGNLNKIELNCPPIPEQRAVAHILGMLDDKIELNRKQNETLEAMARALFKAWFVEFEPVRAKMEGRWQRGQSLPGLPAHLYDLFPDRLVESEVGQIPEGWEISDFGAVSLCLDKYRIPLSSRQRESRKGIIPYHGATSVMDFVDEYIFDGIYLLLGEDGSVLKEDGAPFIQYIWGKSWVNNHAHVLQGANGVCTEHLLLFIASQNITAYVTGAVQLKLNQKNMNSIPFVKASNAINSDFSRTIAPLFDQYRQLYEQSRSLGELRDTLLPKLISGELRVPDAERVAKEVA